MRWSGASIGTMTATAIRTITGTMTTMLSYDFVINALVAGGIVAIVAGIVGFFLVMRGQTFAGHALSHVGFAGATGAVLVGVSPFWGLVALTLAAGLAMGFLGDRVSGRDVAIGMVLSLSLGLGLLFLHFYTAFATRATSLLFGNVFSVDQATVWTLAILGLACLLALAVMARPLLFATLQPDLAEAKGVSVRLVSVLFMAIVAIAVAEAAQIVGVLLVFTLMVGPAAAAQRLSTRLGSGILLTIIIGLVETWLGITLAYHTDWPTSFWIAALSGAVYFLSLAQAKLRG
jgi:zinc/manganese transport system permease protein